MKINYFEVQCPNSEKYMYQLSEDARKDIDNLISNETKCVCIWKNRDDYMSNVLRDYPGKDLYGTLDDKHIGGSISDFYEHDDGTGNKLTICTNIDWLYKDGVQTDTTIETSVEDYDIRLRALSTTIDNNTSSSNKKNTIFVEKVIGFDLIKR